MTDYKFNNTDEEKEIYDKFYDDHAEDCQTKLGIELADLNIICGDNVMGNTEAAMRKALDMIDSGIFKRVLILNTSTKSRRILKLARQVSPDGRIGTQMTTAPVCILHIFGGQLNRSFPEVETIIERHKFDAILINSWEYASMNYRFREELLFRIRTSTEINEMTMIIYSQATLKNYSPGALMRGSLGKLAIMACTISSLTLQERSEIQEKKIQPAPLVEENTEHSDQFISEEGKLDGKFIRSKKKRDYLQIAPPIQRKEEILEELKV